MSALAAIRRGLREHEPLRLPEPPKRRGRAAVALVLGGGEQDPSLCFVKRAKRPGERWSGDMAFPGGWVSPEDADPCGAAVREAREEVGLQLADAACLGQLDDRRIRYPRDEAPPVLSSFVFHVGPALPELHPDGWETEAAWWIALSHLRHEANRTTLLWDTHRMPGILTPPGRKDEDLPEAPQGSSERGMPLRVSLPSSVRITVSLNPAPYSPRRLRVRGRWNTIPAFSGCGLAAER